MLTGPLTARRSNAKTAYGLLSDIAAYILEEPKRVYMGDWVITNMDEIRDEFGVEGPECGTVGCIAGNALLLSGRPMQWVESNATDLLGGADGNLQDDVDDLFLDVEVDAPYGTKKYAQIVAKRIAKFQKEHKAALKAVEIEAVK